jgi:hypothetical protein
MRLLFVKDYFPYRRSVQTLAAKTSDILHNIHNSIHDAYPGPWIITSSLIHLNSRIRHSRLNTVLLRRLDPQRRILDHQIMSETSFVPVATRCGGDDPWSGMHMLRHPRHSRRIADDISKNILIEAFFDAYGEGFGDCQKKGAGEVVVADFCCGSVAELAALDSHTESMEIDLTVIVNGTYEEHLVWMSHHGHYLSNLGCFWIVLVTAHHESQDAACSTNTTALWFISTSI